MHVPRYYLTPEGADEIRAAIAAMREFMRMKRALRAAEQKGGK